MMRSIDVHTHLGDVCKPYTTLIEPTAMNRDAPSVLEKWDYPNFLVRMVRSRLVPTNLLIRYCVRAAEKANTDFLLKSMALAGVTRSFVLPVAPAVGNDEVLIAARGHPELIPLLSLDFSRLTAEEISSEVQKCLQKYPFRGIKFHPNLQHIDPQSEKAIALYLAAAEHGLFIMMHIGWTPFLKGPNGRIAQLSNVIDLPRKYAQTKFVFCHMAGYFDPPRNADFERIAELPNVLLDTSGVSSETVLKGLIFLGPRRIVFGSDWPYGTQHGSLGLVRRAISRFSALRNLNESEILDQVIFQNAEALLTSRPVPAPSK